MIGEIINNEDIKYFFLGQSLQEPETQCPWYISGN